MVDQQLATVFEEISQCLFAVRAVEQVLLVNFFPRELAALTAQVIAKQVTFDVSCIQEPPNAPLTIEFDNQDQGIPHNIEIFTDSNATTRLGGATGPGDVVSGPGTTTYDIPGLPAGTYFFRCDVHPTAMTGQFKVSG